MKFTILASALTLVSAVAGAPVDDKRAFPGCISQHEADKFVKRFSGILDHQGSDLGNFTETAEKLLAPQFQEISDSINSLAGFPLGSITTPSKADYINELAHAPPDSGIETIFVSVANCRNIVWHWNFVAVGDSKYPVKGFNYFEMTDRCQVKQLQLEFNSIAWGLDTGFKVILQNRTVESK